MRATLPGSGGSKALRNVGIQPYRYTLKMEAAWSSETLVCYHILQGKLMKWSLETDCDDAIWLLGFQWWFLMLLMTGSSNC
jgi:hypothetical protein